MRWRPLPIVLAALVAVVSIAVVVRFSFFSQTEHPSLRLSEKRQDRLTERLVIILVDSVPFNMVFEEKKLPYVASLASRGTYGIAWSEEPTMTGQMVYTIVSGTRPYLYGVVRNWRQNRFSHETILDALRAEGLRLELYGDMPWTEMFGDRFHHQVTFPEEGRGPDGRPVAWMNAVNDIDLKILPHLDRALAEPRFDALVWTLHGTDLVMHKYLRDSVITAEKLLFADLMVEGVVRQLDDGRTSFLLLSDHGCAANGRHGYADPEARPTFYLLLGPRIRAGQRLDIQQIDLAPTLAALFGRSPPAASGGRPAVEALDLDGVRAAEVLLFAARQRERYLGERERHQRTGVAADPAPLRQAEKALAAGEIEAAATLATGYLRQAYAADLAARRERRWGPQMALWLALLVLLGGMGYSVTRQVEPPVQGSRPSPSASPGGLRAPLVAGLGLVGLWSLSLVAARYSGRVFNDHVDLWPPIGRIGLWAGLAALLGLGAYLLRRPLARLFGGHPGLAVFVACFSLALLPGYFQGLYALGVALAGLGLVGLLRADPSRRAWIGLLLSAAILGVFLVWQWSWRPHFYGLRDLVQGGPGALAAGLGFLVAAAAVLRPWGRREGEGPLPHVAVLVLAVLVAARHLAFPLAQGQLHPSVGDQLLAQWPAAALPVAVTLVAWWGLHRFCGLRGEGGAALGALAVLAAWSTPFEALASALVVAAFAPFGRLRCLQRPGLGTAALVAALLVTARVVFVQVHEFHFNFTSVHDLFRFAPDVDLELPQLAGPVALRYFLPALVLVPLLWGRLASETRAAALGIALVFAGARVLHLLLITRLTLDQLYPNWRGMGELILTGLWALGLLLAYLAHEAGVAWLGGGRRQAGDASPPRAAAM